MSSRLAIFGGSFDPVHHGHLLLAQDAVELLQLDRLVFVPAWINPHKLEAAPQATPEMRRRLLESAIAGSEQFAIDPIELERGGPSFTIDTVKAFQTRFPEAQLFLLLGEDNLPKLHTWHRFNELQAAVTFVLFGRGTPSTPASPIPPHRLVRLPRRIDISSTEIRQRIARALPIRYLVPESVRLLIQSHALYQLPEQPATRAPVCRGGPR